MPKTTKDLLEFWEDQMKLSHMSSNYFFRKSPSHYHMMLLVMHAFKYKENLTVEELKTKLFKTSRPKSALMINEACEKGFFFLEKTSGDQRKKHIKPSDSFIKEFNHYLDIYPQGRFVTNAHYWKGQAFLYLGSFDAARDSYEIILNEYSESSKLPDAMYGLGLAYQGLGNIARAKQLLNQIKREFPNTGVANLADTRLLSID